MIDTSICYNDHMRRNRKWSEEDKFRFTNERLRATTIPNKKREANRKACRKRTNYRKDY